MTQEHEQLQKEIEILRKEKSMSDRINKLRQTKGSIRTNFSLYVHEVTARYDDKIYISGGVKDSFYITPRDERKKDDKGNTYSSVHLMFRKSSIDGREFPADFIRKGDVIEIDALLTHGYQKLKDSDENPVLVDGKEVTIPTQPQYEGYDMRPKKLSDETRNEYKEYLEARKATNEKKKEEQNKPVDTSQQNKNSNTTSNNSNQSTNQKNDTTPSTQNNENKSSDNSNTNATEGDSLELKGLNFNWED